MTRHIRAGNLARYKAGDLGARKSARVRAHLDGCARCAAAGDDLAAVSIFLSSVPPPPMPAGVTARIEAALAAEAASRVPAGAGATDGAGAGAGTAGERDGAGARGSVTARRSGRAPWRRMAAGWLQSPVALRVAAGAAVAVVVAGGSFAALRLIGSTGLTSSGTASGVSGGSYRSAQSEPGSGEAGPAAVAPAPSLSYRAGGRSVPFTVVTSSVDLGRGSLGRTISGLLAGTQNQPAGSGGAGAGASPAPSAQPDAPATHSANSGTRSGPRQRALAGLEHGTLEGCVTRVAAGGQVRLVDIGRYQGRQAIIIVVAPAAGGPSRIVVVGTACSATDPDVILRTVLPLPG